MPQAHRHDGIPDWVQLLLDRGEHPHVDYKQVTPDDLPKSLAAAANTVALRDLGEFCFLFGVEEASRAGGVREGRVVGLRAGPTGSLRDIEDQKQRVVNAASRVVPPPDVELIECNVAAGPVFFVARVRPTEPPHRFEDRYLVRSGSHAVPLDQVNLRRLMLGSLRRLREETDRGPSSEAMLALLVDEVDAIRSVVGDLALEGHEEADARHRVGQEIARLVEESFRWVHEGVEEAAAQLDETAAGQTQMAETLRDHVDLLHRTTAEGVWVDIQHSRSRAWIEFNRRKELGQIPAEAMSAGRSLFEAFMFEEPDPWDYAANLAERAGWSVLFQAGGPLEHNSWRALLDRTCRAAVGRAHRGRWSGNWMEVEGEDERFDLRDLAVAADIGFDGVPDLPTGASESALLIVDSARLRAELEQAGGVLFAEEELVVVRLADCRLELRVAESGIAALVTVPQPAAAGRPDPVEFFRRLRARLRQRGLEVVRLCPETGGRLAPLAGQRVRRPPGPERRRGV